MDESKLMQDKGKLSRDINQLIRVFIEKHSDVTDLKFESIYISNYKSNETETLIGIKISLII